MGLGRKNKEICSTAAIKRFLVVVDNVTNEILFMIMKKKVCFSLLTLLMISTGVSFAQRIDFSAKGAIGYGFSDTELRGVLAIKAGLYANILVFNPVAIESGVEIKSSGMRVYSALGGLMGVVDFKENYKYRLSYIAIPLCVKMRNEGKWYDGMYAGVGINFPIDGTATYKRTSASMIGVDANDTYKIKNLRSPVISSKMGFDQRYSDKFGLHFEIESLYNPFNRASDSSIRLGTVYLGIIYYI